MYRIVAWIAASIGALRWERAGVNPFLRLVYQSPLLLGLLLPTLVNAQTWQYLYDEVGRLKSAIAPSGDRATTNTTRSATSLRFVAVPLAR